MFEIIITNPETMQATTYGIYPDRNKANEIAMDLRDVTGMWVNVYPAD